MESLPDPLRNSRRLVYLQQSEQKREIEDSSGSNSTGFPGGSEGKAPACNAGDLGSIPGWGRFPGEGNGNPLQYLPGRSHGWRSLVGYSPWGGRESNMTEQLHFHFQEVKVGDMSPRNKGTSQEAPGERLRLGARWPW